METYIFGRVCVVGRNGQRTDESQSYDQLWREMAHGFSVLLDHIAQRYQAVAVREHLFVNSKLQKQMKKTAEN